MNNEDFITINKINKKSDVQSDKVVIPVMDWNTDGYGCTSTLQLKKHTISITKNYNGNVFEEFLDKIFEISEPEKYYERVYEHKTMKEISTRKDVKQLLSRILSCSSYIATNGRIGPAHFVILPYKYYSKLFSLINDNMLTDMYVIPTNLLTDKIIVGRKNDLTQPGIFLFLDEGRNKYELAEIGTAQNQYHILKVTSLQDERRKKLIQINEQL